MNNTSPSIVSFRNCSAIPEPYTDWTQNSFVHGTLVTLWVMMAVIIFFGNVLVILVFFLNRHLQTVTNYYIVNMAFADTATAIFVMPLKLTELGAPCYISFVIFHGIVCQITQYIFMILVFTSLITVVVISIERYIAIIHPFNARFCQSKIKTKSIIFGTWLLPIIVCFPFLLRQSVYEVEFYSEFGTISRLICINSMSPNFRSVYILSFILLFYIVPLIVILFTSSRIIWKLLSPIEMLQNDSSRYTFSSQSQNVSYRREENKRKVAKMIMVIASLYFISWTPFYVIQVVAMFSNFLNRRNYFFTFILIHMMSFFNSMCNPIVYYFMSEKLRFAFKSFIMNILKKPLPAMRKNETSNLSKIDQRLLTPLNSECTVKKNHLYFSENSFQKLDQNHSSTSDYL
uniref:GCR155 n=1 Tax=Schmidtea mediterranea TaxID=79327 RepID=A0A193KUV1_SCHMD|nr:GCR155 [Schmidtea mediterranea]